MAITSDFWWHVIGGTVAAAALAGLQALTGDNFGTNNAFIQLGVQGAIELVNQWRATLPK